MTTEQSGREETKQKPRNVRTQTNELLAHHLFSLLRAAEKQKRVRKVSVLLTQLDQAAVAYVRLRYSIRETRDVCLRRNRLVHACRRYSSGY